MKLHQMLSHIRRNNTLMKIRVQDMKVLLEHKGVLADYFDQTELCKFFKEYFPNYKAGTYIRLNRWQQAIIKSYNRPVSYAELLHVHNWWDRFAELPKRKFPRLDQHDPFLAAKGLLEQEKLKEEIGSITCGIKNPQERNHDLLVVVGTATGFKEQLEKITVPHDTMAVNGAGVKVPCDFFYSIHGSYLRTWKPEVIDPEKTKTICEWWIPGVDSGYGIYSEPLMQLNMFHYSGNMAMMTGLMMGYPKILMVGCPLAPVSTDVNLLHHGDKYLEIDTWEKTLLPQMPKIQKHFVEGIRLFPEILDRVRSCSGGLTEKLLGRYFSKEAPAKEKILNPPVKEIPEVKPVLGGVEIGEE